MRNHLRCTSCSFCSASNPPVLLVRTTLARKYSKPEKTPRKDTGGTVLAVERSMEVLRGVYMYLRFCLLFPQLRKGATNKSIYKREKWLRSRQDNALRKMLESFHQRHSSSSQLELLPYIHCRDVVMEKSLSSSRSRVLQSETEPEQSLVLQEGLPAIILKKPGLETSSKKRPGFLAFFRQSSFVKPKSAGKSEPGVDSFRSAVKGSGKSQNQTSGLRSPRDPRLFPQPWDPKKGASNRSESSLSRTCKIPKTGCFPGASQKLFREDLCSSQRKKSSHSKVVSKRVSDELISIAQLLQANPSQAVSNKLSPKCMKKSKGVAPLCKQKRGGSFAECLRPANQNLKKKLSCLLGSATAKPTTQCFSGSREKSQKQTRVEGVIRMSTERQRGTDHRSQGLYLKPSPRVHKSFENSRRRWASPISPPSAVRQLDSSPLARIEARNS